MSYRCCIKPLIVSGHSHFSLSAQCLLLGVPRSSFYYQPVPVSSAEFDLLSCIDRFHFLHPTFGSRRLGVQFGISRGRAKRLMQLLHLEATYPSRRTTLSNPEHKKFPYLLRDVIPSYPNHIWSTDITYIPLNQGFMYLVAIIDWYSRMILSWRLSNTMDVNFCIDCLREAFENYGEPEYFNSDQGVQFTSQKFQELFAGRATKISMDGKGRWVGNVYTVAGMGGRLRP
ncbi:MAG: DDE-type integrase/transposase/recombinase [Planctomycetaceae bacterium]|jgi:putative transposase|nr:DDE-type integrase/transposase/recombinase [Planctomycetaceae bacterium]